MKKVLFLLFFLTTTFTLKAQEMSFDETVKYINDKIDSKGTTITAKKDGTIMIDGKKFNLLDLARATIASNKIIKQDAGIMLHHYSSFSVDISLTSNSSQTISNFDTERDATRVFNALVHLRNLCAKTKDSFD